MLRLALHDLPLDPSQLDFARALVDVDFNQQFQAALALDSPAGRARANDVLDAMAALARLGAVALLRARARACASSPDPPTAAQLGHVQLHVAEASASAAPSLASHGGRTSVAQREAQNRVHATAAFLYERPAGVHVPPVVSVRYRGHLVLATACVEFSDEQPDVEGSHLALRSFAEGMSLASPSDLHEDVFRVDMIAEQCHVRQGVDGRVYLVNFDTLLPRHPDESAARFRHEFARDYGHVIRESPDEAWRFLADDLLPALATFLDSPAHSPEEMLVGTATVSSLLHDFGINLRLLGRLRALLDEDSLWRGLLLEEMLIRALKCLVRHRMRTMESPNDASYTDAALHLVRADLKEPDFWRTTILPELDRKFAGHDVSLEELSLLARSLAHDSSAFGDLLLGSLGSLEETPSAWRLCALVEPVYVPLLSSLAEAQSRILRTQAVLEVRHGRRDPLVLRALARRMRVCTRWLPIDADEAATEASILTDVLVARAGDDPDLAWLVSEAAMFWRAAGDEERALSLFQLHFSITSGHPAEATSAFNLATSYAERGDHDEAEPLYAKVVECLRKSAPGSSELAEVCGSHGLVLHHLHRFEEAEAAMREGVEIRQRIFERDQDNAEAARELGTALVVLGNFLGRVGKVDECNELMERALVVLDDEPLLAAHAYSCWGSVLARSVRRSDYRAALDSLVRAYHLRRKHLGNEHALTLESLDDLNCTFPDWHKLLQQQVDAVTTEASTAIALAAVAPASEPWLPGPEEPGDGPEAMNMT